jgi:L-threonylcarbamoyladenylate synthase
MHFHDSILSYWDKGSIVAPRPVCLQTNRAAFQGPHPFFRCFASPGHYNPAVIEILSIDRDHPLPAHLDRAYRVLARGGLVIVPTETVYGIACDPSVPGAMDTLLAAKGRDADKPVARLAADAAQAAAEVLHWDARTAALADRYWPGPLTMVLETRDGWTGFRVPDHGAARALARRCGRLLALTSANLSGEPDTRTAEEAMRAVRADLVLDSGPAAETAVPSTVVRVDGDRVECLRAGAIPIEEIEHVCALRSAASSKECP